MDGHGRRVWFDYGRDGVGAARGSVGWRVGVARGWGLRGWWWRGGVALPCYWPLGEGSGGLRRVTGRSRWRWKGSGEWRGMWAEDESKILERLASLGIC